jgi:formyltetrahydrofolate deformylase
MNSSNKTHILLVETEARKNLSHELSSVLYRHNLEIISNRDFITRDDNIYFKRSEFSGITNDDEYVKILCDLYLVLTENAKVQLIEKEKKRVVVFCTKEHHCLGDLLIRNAYEDFNAEILAVISNWDSLAPLVEKFDLPFHHISHEGKSREEHEKEIIDVVYQYNPEYLVLAKYMRILTPQFVSKYPNRIINIHHSFLPAFIGANPYRQAYERGVKIIGATAHFVTDELDEGPIIKQDVVHIDHRKTPAEMSHMGHELERMLLAHALELAFEDRIFVTGNKTIIFD